MITNDAYKINIGTPTENTVSIKSNRTPAGILYKVTSNHWNTIHPDDYDAAGNYGDGITRLESGPNSGRFVTSYAAGSATNFYITTGVVDSITGITASDLESEYTSFEAVPQSNVNKVYKGSNLIWYDKNSHVYVSGTTRVSGQGVNLPSLNNNSDIKSFSLIGDAIDTLPSVALSQCPNLTTVNLGASITGIGQSAFNSCSALTSIIIPDSVTGIGNNAFGVCENLSDVTIGNGVTSIENGTFSTCRSLTSITIPDSVTSIGDSVFSYCNNLTGITIPSNVTSIGSGAFKHANALTTINLLASSPPSDGGDIFYTGTVETREIHVPASASAAYGSTYAGLDVVADIT